MLATVFVGRDSLMITCGIAWAEAHYDLALVETKTRRGPSEPCLGLVQLKAQGG